MRLHRRTRVRRTGCRAAGDRDLAQPVPRLRNRDHTAEFSSVCPKTGLPDFGELVLRYVPDKLCLELKSYKMYLLEYRNLGIFQENVVNRVLRDVVAAARPVSATVIGDFTPRGGLSTLVTASWARAKRAAPRTAPRAHRGKR